MVSLYKELMSSLPGDGTSCYDSRQLSVLTPTRLREYNNYRKPPPNQFLGHSAYTLVNLWWAHVVTRSLSCVVCLHIACIWQTPYTYQSHCVGRIYHLPDL
jgi:hypothetical protein